MNMAVHKTRKNFLNNYNNNIGLSCTATKVLATSQYLKLHFTVTTRVAIVLKWNFEIEKLIHK